jgi:hypothetical protein
MKHVGQIATDFILMMTFYFTFAFSAPYVPIIPNEGPDADLFYPG